MPGVGVDTALWRATQADVAAYRAAQLDALATSPIVKAVTLSKNPVLYLRFSETSGIYALDTMQHADGNIHGSVILGADAPALTFTFTMPNSGGNGYLYVRGPAPSYTFQAGDYLEYDVYWLENSDDIALDLNVGAGSLRDSGAVDQNGLSAHPNENLNAFAVGRWYHRRIAIPGGWTASVLLKWMVGCEVDGAGVFTGRIRNPFITDGAGSIRYRIWTDPESLPTFTTDIVGAGAPPPTVAIARSNRVGPLLGDPASTGFYFPGASAGDVTTNLLTGLSQTTLSVGFWYQAPRQQQDNDNFFDQAGSLSYAKQGVNDRQFYAYLNAPGDFATPRRLRFRLFRPWTVDGRWHHRGIAVSINGQGRAEAREYEDAVLLDDANLMGGNFVHMVDYTGDASSPSGGLRIIGGPNGVFAQLGLKDFAVFNATLSPADWSDLYLAGKNALGAVGVGRDIAL